jgi:DNA-binding transcriptional LysR family regulator
MAAMHLSTPVRDFDIDVLRSLVAMTELGSLALASERRGRTVAALSLQMRKLEDQAGASLFFKDGRKLALTSAGEVVLSYARRILALNDEAQLSLRGSSVSGLVRLGTSQDFGEAWLPPVLAQFHQKFPAVGLEVLIDRSSHLVHAVEDNSLDIVLTMGMGNRPNTVCVGHLPLVWIAHRDFEWNATQPLSLAVFPTPCRFRAKANAELDAAGIAWKIALTSSSLYGIWAAVRARLGVTLRTEQGLLPELEVVDRKFNLPNMGHVDVSLAMASPTHSPAVASLTAMLHDALRQRVSQLGGQVPLAAIVA